MPPVLPKATLLAIKRALISARAVVQDATATARRAGDTNFADRLRGIAERLADELDYVEWALANLP
jgi:hypothetical protein